MSLFKQLYHHSAFMVLIRLNSVICLAIRRKNGRLMLQFVPSQHNVVQCIFLKQCNKFKSSTNRRFRDKVPKKSNSCLSQTLKLQLLSLKISLKISNYGLTAGYADDRRLGVSPVVGLKRETRHLHLAFSYFSNQVAYRTIIN